MRYPGRVLGAGETPPRAMVRYVADQIGATPEAFVLYARRKETRRDHTARLMMYLDTRSATVQDRRAALLAAIQAATQASIPRAMPTMAGSFNASIDIGASIKDFHVSKRTRPEAGNGALLPASFDQAIRQLPARTATSQQTDISFSCGESHLYDFAALPRGPHAVDRLLRTTAKARGQEPRLQRRW